METYCLKYRKYTKNIKLQISSTSNNKIMIISKCAVCNSRKCRFTKKTRSKRIIK